MKVDHNPMTAGPTDEPKKYNAGPVNGEAIIDSVDDVDPLRRAMCANCAESALKEKAKGSGLETYVQCNNCGEKYDT